MRGRHVTNLVYVHEGGEIEVGEVTCVPRKGELVLLPGLAGAHRVEQVTWTVGDGRVGVFEATPSTSVRVALSRCP